MKAPTADQMRGLDAAAINEIGIPGIVLMENAGRSTAEVAVTIFGNPEGKTVSIFAGPGNNGGDGLVIARYLYRQGAKVRIYLLAEQEKISGDAAVNFAIAQNIHLTMQFLSSEEDLKSHAAEIENSWLLVDALFGTGLKRQVTGLFAETIRIMNRTAAPTLSVDIPSGLDSDSGQIMGEAVQAVLTATYGQPKPGHFLYPGRDLCGDLRIIDIGIPPDIVEQADIRQEILLEHSVKTMLPERPSASHKGTFGHLLILAGSSGKTGAAILSARGALRSGTGLVSLCVPKNLNPIFETSLAEAMTIVLPHSKDRLSDADLETIWEALKRKKACALGPGLGTESQTVSLVSELYGQVKIPMVVDADGLNILASRKISLSQVAGPRILTPHPGELSRLTGQSVDEIQSSRLATARSFAEEHQVYLVLKGADTIIAAPDGRAAINTTGNPGMATGGMGDVLTGILGGLLAQGVEPWRAACAGVYLHGAAADRLARKTKFGYLAEELADALPLTLTELNGI